MSFIYEARITQFSKELKKHTSSSRHLGIARLMVFVSIFVGIYFYWGETVPIVLFVFGGGAIFLRLVVLNGKIDTEIHYLEALISINRNEKEAVSGTYQNPENGAEFMRSDHEYSHDFDLFGLRSFFSKFNRTVTVQGKSKLADWLTEPELNSTKIEQKQEGIKELINKLDWRQDFLANGMINQLSQKDQDRITHWHELKSELNASSLYKVVLRIIPVITVLLLLGAILGWVSWANFGWYLLIPISFVGSQLKKVNHEYGIISNLVTKFDVLAKLTRNIEEEKFESEILKEWRRLLLATDSIKASAKLHQLKSLLGSFEQRSNMLVGIVLNAFLLWDLQLMQRMNRWKEENSMELTTWLEIIGKFDAAISIANMAYNHKDFYFPQISAKEFEVSGMDMKHPMLDTKMAIGNDFELKGQGSVHIITGANMAGKSTFLRTVGLNMIMGMMGAPVPVSNFTFSPMMIFSSMRTEDSLAEQTSFFYAELSRLARISDILKAGEKRFVILDEILKGTNSHDKARGSYAFVEKMIHYNMMGLIATHDLSLCELAGKHPDKIQNKSFEVEFDKDELVFDYKLRNQVCQNMNASFLLKKMGIVDHY